MASANDRTPFIGPPCVRVGGQWVRSGGGGSGFSSRRWRWSKHAGEHSPPVRTSDLQGGGPEACARDRAPQLALEPGARDAEPRELGQHFDEIRPADELDLVAHRPPRRESV